MDYQKNNEGLRIQDLKVDFRISDHVVHAVKNINLSVERGKITVLVGESGSGKTVTALAVMGLLPSNLQKVEGKIWIDGSDVLTMNARQRQKINGSLVGMIFQDPVDSLNPLYTIGNQITEGLRYHRGMSRAVACQKAIEQLQAVNLKASEALMKKYPFELSGGMCQRVMIAIAMSLEPRYLIADEPTTALDVTVQKQILSEICRMSKEKNMGVLFITHDLGVVAEIADEVYIIQNGEMMESGDVYHIFDHPSNEYTKQLMDAIL